MKKHILEPSAQRIADATSKPPFLYELGPEGARKVLDDVQAAPIDKPDVDEKWITVPAEVGDVRVRIVRPPGRRPGPAGDPLHARRRLGARQRRHPRPARPRARRRRRRRGRVRRVRPLARGPLPGRDRAGATRRPVDRARGRHRGPRPRPHRGRRRLGRRQHDRRADAHGQAARRRHFVHQSLYYPVTDAAQDTDSYREFADGPFLTAKGMAWFWDAYLPEPDQRGARSPPRPLRASLDELAGLPPAFVIVDENDVLRDEGEAYARRLTEAGVPHHQRPLQRHHPRLHDAQSRPRHRRHDGRRRAGDPRPPQGTRERVGDRYRAHAGQRPDDP